MTTQYKLRMLLVGLYLNYLSYVAQSLRQYGMNGSRIDVTVSLMSQAPVKMIMVHDLVVRY